MTQWRMPGDFLRGNRYNAQTFMPERFEPMRRSLILLCAAFAVFAGACPVSAQDWTVDKKKSSVRIVGKKPTGPLTGAVDKWDGKIIFDPEHLDTSRVSVSIDVGSIRIDDKQWDTVLPGPKWLAAKAFPLATFESTDIHFKGGNAYEADGTVTVRGIRQSVSLPFTVDMTGGTARAKGTLSLIRTDFGIGGVMETEPDIGILVGVTFDLTASK